MRWLKREEGASMVLIGLLLVVLLALAGIVIDLGSLYSERRELRNGADAAVLAIAEDCGTGARPCDETTALATALAYAQSNEHAGGASVYSLDLDLANQTVRVVTHAVDPETGEEGVRVKFMGILGFDRMRVGASATALWSSPSTGRGLPLIYEECEFYKAGGYGPEYTVTLSFHNPLDDTEPTDCTAGPAGSDAPGAFGWLDPIEGICEAYVEKGWWTPAEPGEGSGRPPMECTADYIRQTLYDQDVYVPLYSTVREQGAGTEYLVVGFGSFHVTAYRLGNARGFREPASFGCPNGPSEVCLQGYFNTDTIFTGIPGGPDFGVTIVKLIE